MSWYFKSLTQQRYFTHLPFANLTNLLTIIDFYYSFRQDKDGKRVIVRDCGVFEADECIPSKLILQLCDR